MNSKGKIAAISLSAVALGGVVGVGISYADGPTPSAPSSASSSPSSSASPSATPSPKAGADKHTEHGKRGLVRRALHGEVTLGGKQPRVVAFQRGAVDRVSETSITLRSTDGFTASYLVTTDTKVRKDGEAAKITDIKTGDEVRVLALTAGSTSTAKVVAEPKQH